MPYYHTYIIYTDKKNKRKEGFFYNFDKEEVEKMIAAPYMKNRPILGKEFISPYDIEEISIFESEKLFEELILPDGKSPLDETDRGYIADCFHRKMMDVNWVTNEFITSPPKQIGKTKSESVGGKKDKVFIGHGRDLKEALELQKYFRDSLKVDALMFEDLKKESGCKTIIELLDYFKENVGYAFIIFTPDDYGCICEKMDDLTNKLYREEKKSRTETINEVCDALEKRARQNVVFELGLFIGAIPRDRVCYLLQEDVSDTPSNMDGVLYEPFDKSISDTFIAIAEKLKKTEIAKT